MRRHDETTAWLSELRLFAACSRGELATAAKNLTPLAVSAGDVIIEEGAVGREFFVITKGTAQVLVGRRPIAYLHAGDFCGEVALLDRRERTATVVAETDLRVLNCSRPEFAALLVGAPSVSRQLLAGLAGRLRATDALLAS